MGRVVVGEGSEQVRRGKFVLIVLSPLPGLRHRLLSTHGLRRGLYSFAAPRLLRLGGADFFQQIEIVAAPSPLDRHSTIRFFAPRPGENASLGRLWSLVA